MSLKLDANMSAVAHHIIDGPTTFPYAIDAHSAVSRFPNEWSHEPWSAAHMAEARNESGAPALELTPEEQAAIDQHAKDVAAANERLKKFRAEQEEKRQRAEQAVADEALVKSAPPMPEPKRPLTPAQVRKHAATLTAEEQAELDASRQGSG